MPCRNGGQCNVAACNLDDRADARFPAPQPAWQRYRRGMLRESPRTNGILGSLVTLHRMGLRLVPLSGKRAIIKDWPSLRLAESEIRSWCRQGVNFGIITGEPLVVLDTDTDEAEAWVQAKGIASPVVVQSGGGGLHRYFRSPEDIEVRSRLGMHRIRGLDVKGFRSYIVAPGSIHPDTRRRYEYLPGKELIDVEELPVFDLAWSKENRPEPLLKPKIGNSGNQLAGHIRDVRAYIRRIPSIQGQGGDRACFRVACLLVEAGFDYASAVAEMEAWNEVAAIPRWRHEELERKLRYAFKRVLGVEMSG
jgi:hypothetical protein